MFVLYVAFSRSCHWTYVYHEEALVAPRNWRYFHLTENSVQVFIFQMIPMHMHLLLSNMSFFFFYNEKSYYYVLMALLVSCL